MDSGGECGGLSAVMVTLKKKKKRFFCPRHQDSEVMALLKLNHINRSTQPNNVFLPFFLLHALLTWLAARPHKCKVPIQEEYNF